MNINCLPVAIKIAARLSSLDDIILRNKLELSDIPISSYVFSIDIPKSDYSKILGIDIINEFEKKLIDKVVDELNYLFKGATKLKLFSLCKNISLSDDYKMRLITDFEIIGSRNDKLKRILCTTSHMDQI